MVLRREPFGGLVFNPSDGTLLELDREAFELVLDAVKGLRAPVGGDETALMAKVAELFPDLGERRLKIILPREQIEPRPDLHFFGAPTLVDFQITTRCLMECPHCYASATPDGRHVPIEDMEIVVERAGACGVCQLAVGGGEPLLHPGIGDLLALCHKNGIVPNLSTNGMHLSGKNLSLLKRYCGAVALSLEAVGERFGLWRKDGFRGLEKAMDKLKKARVPTVIQVTLSEANFGDLPQIVDFCLAKPHLYGVIFLAYKPVGRGVGHSRPLSVLPPDGVARGLREAFLRLSKVMRVGYDCCMTPAVAGIEAGLEYADPTHLEGCSGMRGSVGVSPDLDVIPCTFLTGEVMGNLRDESLEDIWKGERARAFRERITNRAGDREACIHCAKKANCLGGCPVMRLVECSMPG